MISSIVLFVITFLLYSKWVMPWNETRTSLVELPDPVFPYVPRLDMSMHINVLHYMAMVWFFVFQFGNWDIELFLFTFVNLMVCRSIVLLLHPFRCHHDVIPLRDWIQEWFLGQNDSPFLHDLSFSGHVSTVMCFGFLLPEYKLWFWAQCGLVALFMICGRIHYSADLFTAIPFAYFCFQNAPVTMHMWHSLTSWY